MLYLDSLRGLAALSVALKHHVYVFGKESWAVISSVVLPRDFWHDGGPEVGLFFVLSGFVLSYKALTKPQPDLKPKFLSFYGSRVLRLYPAFIAVLLLGFFVRPWAYAHIADSHHLEALRFHWPLSVGTSDLFKQALLWFPWTTDDKGMPLVPPDWTLVLEVKYSLMFPFLLLSAWGGGIGLLFSSVLLFIWGGDHHFIGFCGGIFLSYYFSSIRRFFSSYPVISKSLLGLGALALYYVVPPSLEIRNDICDVAGIFVICCVISWERLHDLLETPLLLYLGRISYCIYLCHFIILLSLEPHWRLWTKTIPAGSIIDLGIFIALTIALASAIHYLIEKPCMRLRTQLPTLFKKPAILADHSTD